ncbi:MAG: flavin reductase family protein [Bacteroidota bacterium]
MNIETASIPRRLLEKITNGLYVVTTRKKGEEMETRDKDYISAATIAWLTQSSFEPPMITLAIDRTTDLAETVAKSEVFVVNFLGKDQAEIAQAFGKESKVQPNEMKINGYDYHHSLELGVPTLKAAIGYLECELDEMTNIKGDHILYTGIIVGGELHQPQAQPLAELNSGMKYGG